MPDLPLLFYIVIGLICGAVGAAVALALLIFWDMKRRDRRADRKRGKADA